MKEGTKEGREEGKERKEQKMLQWKIFRRWEEGRDDMKEEIDTKEEKKG